ncbi:hypothetical protein C8R45DRAFT_936655 [Mycena sanguinolenta]|nr:hypothetical protein C8R45DRAFT_936655 [Mycena sanguinolenta]
MHGKLSAVEIEVTRSLYDASALHEIKRRGGVDAARRRQPRFSNAALRMCPPLGSTVGARMPTRENGREARHEMRTHNKLETPLSDLSLIIAQELHPNSNGISVKPQCFERNLEEMTHDARKVEAECDDARSPAIEAQSREKLGQADEEETQEANTGENRKDPRNDSEYRCKRQPRTRVDPHTLPFCSDHSLVFSTLHFLRRSTTGTRTALHTSTSNVGINRVAKNPPTQESTRIQIQFLLAFGSLLFVTIHKHTGIVDSAQAVIDSLAAGFWV